MTNNTKLNETIERLTNNEVLTCQSSLVEMLLGKEILAYDDVTNFYIDNSSRIEEKENLIDTIQENEELDEVLKEQQENEIDDIQNEIDQLEADQEDPQEIMEWWLVSSWLAGKLEENGECILDTDYGVWWGRTCTGQSISMDYVMQTISENLMNN